MASFQNKRFENGSKMEWGPGDVVDIPPGNDARVVGNEPAVILESGCPAISK